MKLMELYKDVIDDVVPAYEELEEATKAADTDRIAECRSKLDALKVKYPQDAEMIIDVLESASKMREYYYERAEQLEKTIKSE